MEVNQIITGDTLSVLKTMPRGFVDTIITSPPYWGLRDYGIKGQIGLEPTLEEYINKLLAITTELKRVLKPTGVMFWNHGDCYGGSMGSTGHTPETKNLGRKTFEYGAYPSISTQGKMTPKCMMLQNYRLILRMIDEQGWILRNVIQWHKPNNMPSSVKDRFSNTYEPVFMLVKQNKPQYYYNTKTGLMADRKSKVLKEGIDWDWKEPEELPKGLTPKDFETDWEYRQYIRAGKEYDSKEPYKTNAPGCRKLTRKKVSYWQSLNYWFDLGAVRIPHETEYKPFNIRERGGKPVGFMASPQETGKTKIPKKRAKSYGSPRARYHENKDARGNNQGGPGSFAVFKSDNPSFTNPAGKNPGDLWTIPTQPFPQAHFATFPEKLVEPMVLAACPEHICMKCGKARVRITEVEYKVRAIRSDKEKHQNIKPLTGKPNMPTMADAQHKILGWTNCGCKAGWRPGIVLDPFMGAGTIAVVAKGLARSFLGIELNPEYVKMAEKRIRNTMGRLL